MNKFKLGSLKSKRTVKLFNVVPCHRLKHDFTTHSSQQSLHEAYWLSCSAC